MALSRQEGLPALKPSLEAEAGRLELAVAQTAPEDQVLEEAVDP